MPRWYPWDLDQDSGVQILTLPRLLCVILGKSLKFLGYQISHPQNRPGAKYFAELLRKAHAMLCRKTPCERKHDWPG